MSDRRTETLQRMETLRVSAILRTDDGNRARTMMQAAVDGGFRMIEFTLTTPGAIDLIREFSADERLLVGAGTVLSPEQACEAVEAGARFLVSPVVDAGVIGEARRLDAVAVPGTSTPTEMMTADRAGADVLKVFPAPADIVTFVKQVRGPLPHLKLFPTAGVDAGNVEAVLAAGAFGAGFVASLFTPQDLADTNAGAVRERAAGLVAKARAVRSG